MLVLLPYSPLPSLQRCFPYEKQMDGMQSALAGLPTAGVYVLGAALAAGLGGAGFFGGQALAPGALCGCMQGGVEARLEAGWRHGSMQTLYACLPPALCLPPVDQRCSPRGLMLINNPPTHAACLLLQRG